MTASPGREVDANLLRGAALGSAQPRADAQDAGGQDLGDLVEALGRGHEVGVEGVGHVRVGVVADRRWRDGGPWRNIRTVPRADPARCGRGGSTVSPPAPRGVTPWQHILDERSESARFPVDRPGVWVLCSGYVLGRPARA